MRRTAITSFMVWVLLLIPVVHTSLAQVSGQISSPRDRAAVRGQVPIEGSATHPQFLKYEVQYGPEPNPGDQWSPVGNSPFDVPVVQGRLALWDTTVVPDGVYSLRLRVVRLDGNYEEYFVRGIQVSNTRPTETPTPEKTPTPAPPTETPSPTPTVIIGVPTVSSPTPKPTATLLPTVPPTATPEPLNLPFQNISSAVCWGAGGSLALFVGVGLFFALKGGLVSLCRRVVQRGREGFGVYKE